MPAMRAVSISGDHKISIIETAMPKLADGEVLGGDLAALIEPLACVLHAAGSSQGVKDKTVQVGVHDEDAAPPFNPFRIYEREIRIIGSNSCANKFAEAVDVMPDIQGQARHLIGKSFPMWNFDAAAGSMAAGHSIKTQLHVPD